MSYDAVKGPASQYIVIHHTPRSPFAAGLLIWPEIILLIRMSSLTFSPFQRIYQFSIHRTFLILKPWLSLSLRQPTPGMTLIPFADFSHG